MKRLVAILLSLGMLGILAAPVAAQRPATNGLLSNIDVTGALEDGGTFEGVLSITEIALNDGVLEATGTLSGTATDALGNVTEIVDQAFTTTFSLAGDGDTQARCDILFLELGPIFLDLLGLVVELDQIVLDVYAVPGAGNLLGNLLCAVAGLLDGGLGGVTGALENLINQINRLL